MHPNPFVMYGRKAFSQADEDGIIFEIVRRLGLAGGTFIELGVGTGVENNTLALAASKWRGEWFGGQSLAFDLPVRSRVHFTKVWIDRNNVTELIKDACSRLQVQSPDLISIDLDGNDLFLIEQILSARYAPKVWVCEYNGKLIPPIDFSIDYLDAHQWQGDDYFGASLCAINNLMQKYRYKAVCCNAATGANAFFVKDSDFVLFPEVPDEIGKIYSSPNYNLLNYFSHKLSKETILRCLDERL